MIDLQNRKFVYYDPLLVRSTVPSVPETGMVLVWLGVVPGAVTFAAPTACLHTAAVVLSARLKQR